MRASRRRGGVVVKAQVEQERGKEADGRKSVLEFGEPGDRLNLQRVQSKDGRGKESTRDTQLKKDAPEKRAAAACRRILHR